MTYRILYTFVFPQSTILDAGQALNLVRAYVDREFRQSGRDVSRMTNLTSVSAEVVTVDFMDRAQQAVRCTFLVDIVAQTEEFANQLVHSAVTLNRTPTVSAYYCIGKDIERL